MTVSCNLRNGGSGDGPILWSTATHEYAIVIRLDWGLTVGKHALNAPFEAWETYDLSADPIAAAALSLPVDVADDHHRMAICVDRYGYIHIVGNQHQDERHYIKSSSPNDITEWFDAKDLIEASISGYDPDTAAENLGSYSYNNFRPDPVTGDIYWQFQQNDRIPPNSPYPLGRDVCLWRLPYTSEVGEGMPLLQQWQPCPGTTDGQIMGADEIEDNGDDERPYDGGWWFDHTGVLHWFGFHQLDYATGLDRGRLHYFKRTTDNVWRSITGTPITMPNTYAQSLSAGLILPDQLFPYTNNWQPWLTPQGHPSVVCSSPGDPNLYRRHYWDGSAWQYVNDAATGGGHLFTLRNELWRSRTVSNRYRIQKDSASTQRVMLSGDVEASYSPFADPVRMHQGIYAVMNADGDQPRSFQMGAGLRLGGA